MRGGGTGDTKDTDGTGQHGWLAWHGRGMAVNGIRWTRMPGGWRNGRRSCDGSALGGEAGGEGVMGVVEEVGSGRRWLEAEVGTGSRGRAIGRGDAGEVGVDSLEQMAAIGRDAGVAALSPVALGWKDAEAWEGAGDGAAHHGAMGRPIHEKGWRWVESQSMEGGLVLGAAVDAGCGGGENPPDGCPKGWR